MIWDSSPWKDELLRDADILQRWAQKSGFSNRQGFLMEKKVFIAAYAIRKLFEAEKLRTTLKHTSILCDEYASRDSTGMGPHNNHRLDSFYDIENPNRVSVNVRVLADQIIHSYVFMLSGDEDKVDGFFVASEHERHKRLLRVPIDSFCDFMRQVGNDSVVESRMIRNGKTGEWTVTNR